MILPMRCARAATLGRINSSKADKEFDTGSLIQVSYKTIISPRQRYYRNNL